MSRRSGTRRGGTNRSVLAFAGLALGLSLAACSSSGSTDAAQDAPAAPEASAAGSGLLDVSTTAIGGGDVDLRQYEGKPLVLWFWAPG